MLYPETDARGVTMAHRSCSKSHALSGLLFGIGGVRVTSRHRTVCCKSSAPPAFAHACARPPATSPNDSQKTFDRLTISLPAGSSVIGHYANPYGSLRALQGELRKSSGGE